VIIRLDPGAIMVYESAINKPENARTQISTVYLFGMTKQPLNLPKKVHVDVFSVLLS